MNGIKGDNTSGPGDMDVPNTGAKLRIVTQDGRNPSVKNIDIGTLRTDHDRKDQVSEGHPDTVSPELGKVGNGPASTEKPSSLTNAQNSGVGTGPKYK